jgi:glycosyltransferase involved in cell wall biosynthesis
MTEAERQEEATTTLVLPIGFRFIAAHVESFARRPLRWLATLRLALRLGGLHPLRLARHLVYFAEAVFVGHVLLKRGIQHLHTHFSSTVAILAAEFAAVDVSMTIHGPGEFDDVRGFHLAEKVARARFVVAISDYGKSQIMRAADPTHWEKVVVCRLGVDVSLFKPALVSTSADAFEIVCVARLAPVKAQLLLIRAVVELKRRGHVVRLRLVGPGPDELRLREAATLAGVEQHVVFEGARNQDEVLEFYRRASVFALPSFAEGVPVVLMEAMSTGLPCVATWVNGVPELIEHDVSGLLVPPASVEALVAALERLALGPETARRLSEAGRARIRESYDLGRNVAALASIFRNRVAPALAPSPPTLAVVGDAHSVD